MSEINHKELTELTDTEIDMVVGGAVSGNSTTNSSGSFNGFGTNGATSGTYSGNGVFQGSSSVALNNIGFVNSGFGSGSFVQTI